MADSDFTFVLSTANGHVAQPERLRVRSYCMKGKNKRHSSRRSVREAKRAARAEKSRDDDDGSPSTALIPATYVPPPSLLDGDLIAFAKDIDMTSREMLHQCEYMIPRVLLRYLFLTMK